jgi:hypothetical protein
MILGSAAVKTCVHNAEGADRALKYGDVLECRRFLIYFKQNFSGLPADKLDRSCRDFPHGSCHKCKSYIN